MAVMIEEIPDGSVIDWGSLHSGSVIIMPLVAAHRCICSPNGRNVNTRVQTESKAYSKGGSLNLAVDLFLQLRAC